MTDSSIENRFKIEFFAAEMSKEIIKTFLEKYTFLWLIKKVFKLKFYSSRNKINFI